MEKLHTGADVLRGYGSAALYGGTESYCLGYGHVRLPDGICYISVFSAVAGNGIQGHGCLHNAH